MNESLFHSAENSRRGVALIIVLGFLSIMIIMALAFLTQARTERMVADVSLDAQRGRQMARTGLNAAMSDLSRALYPSGGVKYMLPLPDSDFDLFLSSAGYASGEVQTDGDDTLDKSGHEVMKGEARNWIPQDYLQREDEARDNTHWILVREDPSKGAGKDNPVIGRYAYMCFDMSGGIDANLIARDIGVANVGNSTNRSSVRGLGMEELKEMLPIDGAPNPPDASLFKRLRRGWHGFDTLSELILLTNGRYNGGENSKAATHDGAIYYYIDEGVSAEELPPNIMWNAPGGDPRWRSGSGWTRVEEKNKPALNSTNVSDLVPYSLATFRGWEYDPNKAEWNTDNLMAWDEHESWTSGEWDIALEDMKDQFEGQSVPTWWPDALEDFTTDTSTVPKGTNYPSPKNVPMLNEVSLTVTPIVHPTVPNQLIMNVALGIETWFPFPADENKRTGSYTINPVIGGGPSWPNPPPGVDIYIPMRGLGNAYTVPEWTASATTPLSFSAVNGVPINQGVLNYTVNIPVAMPSTLTNLAATMPLRILQTTGAGIVILDGTAVADWMPAEVLDLVAQAGVSLPLFPAAPALGQPYFWEVTDPRLNYMLVNAWLPGSGTMGGINAEADSHGYDSNGDSTTFYCRNDSMTSPVELGYFSTGHPWQTLEFCTKEGADTLARIGQSRDMLDQLSANGVAYTNGTITPNTSSSNVLMAAFAGLQIKDDGTALDDAELSELIDAFDTITASKKVVDTSNLTEFEGACMRGVDWIWAKPFQPGEDFTIKGWSKNERHRLIERTWGLFNPNNSMFTVLVVGQAVKEGPAEPGAWSEDDMITGERRAVALVWRDPTPPGKDKPHEMFIRIFKFLDE